MSNLGNIIDKIEELSVSELEDIAFSFATYLSDALDYDIMCILGGIIRKPNGDITYFRGAERPLTLEQTQKLRSYVKQLAAGGVI